MAGMTALGIPVSFLGGILMAHALGVSMNMMTMFALNPADTPTNTAANPTRGERPMDL